MREHARRFLCAVLGHHIDPDGVHAWCSRCGKFLYYRRRETRGTGRIVEKRNRPPLVIEEEATDA